MNSEPESPARCGEPVPGAATTMLARILEDGTQMACLTVTGTCMAPLVEEGDEIEVRADPGGVRRGALVVALTDSAETVCHRVLGRDANGLIHLSGDRAGRVDEVEDSRVVGVVLRVRRGDRVLELGHAPGRWLDWLIASLRWATLPLRGPRPLPVRVVRRGVRILRGLLVRTRAIAWRFSTKL